MKPMNFPRRREQRRMEAQERAEIRAAWMAGSADRSDVRAYAAALEERERNHRGRK